MDNSAAERLLTRLDLARDDRFVVVGEAGDDREAIAHAARLRPDVVLLDVEMPGMDGPTAFPGIRVACPNAWVIVFSLLDPSDAMGLFPSPRPVAALGKSLLLGLPDELASILLRLESPASRKEGGRAWRIPGEDDADEGRRASDVSVAAAPPSPRAGDRSPARTSVRVTQNV